MVAGVGTPATGQTGPRADPLEMDVTAATWNQAVAVSRDKPVVLDFGGKMCQGCEEINAALRQMVTTDRGAWIIGHVDREAAPELLDQFGVFELPTLVVLRNGIDQTQVVPRKVGYTANNQEWLALYRWVQSVRNGDYPPAVPPDPNVEVTVTTENIDSVLAISRDKPVVLEFGAPWCSACKELKPHMQKFAAADGGRWLLGQVNGDKYPQFNTRFAVKGYPTLVALRNGVEVSRKFAYNGDPATYRKWVNTLLR
ncbi:hypothetical protein Acsp05_28550 [Actinokineospora sp. NBRC 105648]|nr:hypothetical protein Acsp05_28550 [Actinokineospora sp. NBRC 105648]